MDCSIPGLNVPHHLPKFAQLHVYCISNAIQPSHPLKPSSPSALNLSQPQRLFQWVSCSHQMTKILTFQLQHQSFQRVFRTDFPWDWLVWSPFSPRDFQESSLATQFKGINSWLSDFIVVQLSQPYMTTGKTIDLTIQTFVSRMSLLFNTLSRYVIAFLPRSNHLLISWLQSPCAVTLEPPKEEICHYFHFPFYLLWSNGAGCHDLSWFFFFFLIFSFKLALSFSPFTLIKKLFSSSWQSGVISISEVADVSPAYLDSSL